MNDSLEHNKKEMNKKLSFVPNEWIKIERVSQEISNIQSLKSTDFEVFNTLINDEEKAILKHYDEKFEQVINTYSIYKIFFIDSLILIICIS